MADTRSGDLPDRSGRDGTAVRVLVAGPSGRMGGVMMTRLPDEKGIEVVGGVSRSDHARRAELFAGADVLVDFTNADSAPELLLAAIDAGVRPVSGTSGISEEALAQIDEAARERAISALWAPAFHLGAVVLMHAARMAARYYSGVEIFDVTHDTKWDAPSGTALELAKVVRAGHGAPLPDPPVGHETVPGTRGGLADSVRIHSVRLPDILGWQEVVFSGAGSIVTFRQQNLGRAGVVPSVAHSVREIVKTDRVGLIRGYDSILGLAS
jgi:4-hydroxy-tetrahydrodipicolinate reductase